MRVVHSKKIHWSNVGSMLVHRLRHWPKMELTWDSCLPFGVVLLWWGHNKNTKLYNICTTSAQRLRRWSNFVQMLYKSFFVVVGAGEVNYGCDRLSGAGLPPPHTRWRTHVPRLSSHASRQGRQGRAPVWEKTTRMRGGFFLFIWVEKGANRFELCAPGKHSRHPLAARL